MDECYRKSTSDCGDLDFLARLTSSRLPRQRVAQLSKSISISVLFKGTVVLENR